MATTEWTIPDLLQLSGGYWSTCALHAGVRLDIFSVLDGTARTAAEVAQLRELNPRATAMLLDALAALGLLEKLADRYVATLFAAHTLTKTSPGYQGHIVMHHHHLMPGWAQLHEAVATGLPVSEHLSPHEEELYRESFLMGMFNLASQRAPSVARSINLTGCRTILDLGGGPGTYAIHFCRANPELSAVVYDLPTTRKFAEETIERFALSDRIVFEAGDYHSDPVPTGFDAAWLSHVLHSAGPAACAALLRTAAAALNAGGLLMVQEFIQNDAKDGPLFPALFSLNMLLRTENGQSYSEGELRSMMEGAGLSDVTRLDLDLPNGAGVLAGWKR